MPVQSGGGYNPGAGTPSLGALVSASTGSAHTAAQEYTIAAAWLRVLLRAATHMTATPRLRKEGVLLAKAVTEATGTISAATAGGLVTIPASVMARLARSSAKHLGSSSRLRVTTQVKHIDRPLVILADSLIVDPKVLSLTAKAGIADRLSLNLTATTQVTGEEFVPLGVLTVVTDSDREINLSVDTPVALGRALSLTAETVVEAEQVLSTGADAAVLSEDHTLDLDVDAAVQQELTLTLGSQAAVRVLNQAKEVACDSAVRAEITASVQAASAVARIRRAELESTAFVVYNIFGTAELDADTVAAFIRRLELEMDTQVDEYLPPDAPSTTLHAACYVIVRGQLDAHTYVVPIPRATWVLAHAAVKTLDTTKSVSTDTFVVL